MMGGFGVKYMWFQMIRIEISVASAYNELSLTCIAVSVWNTFAYVYINIQIVFTYRRNVHMSFSGV